MQVVVEKRPLNGCRNGSSSGSGSRGGGSSSSCSCRMSKQSVIIERWLSVEHLVDDVKILEDDAFILRVIEAYCTSTKARQAVNSCMYILP